VNKIANLDLSSLENNLSVLRTIISCVVLALALVSGTIVALKTHSNPGVVAASVISPR
jgi:hypothetical protein